MKSCFIAILCLASLQVCAQQQKINDNRNNGISRDRYINNNPESNKRIYDYNYVQKKPFFAAGKDSLNNIYLANFLGFDSLATRCINNGDTAKYIRVHFEFVLDEKGTPYDAKYTYIGTTRYGSSSGDKKVKYFDDLKPYFENAIRKMLQHTPDWKPAMDGSIRVHCFVKDSFQFWLGINPEPKSVN